MLTSKSGLLCAGAERGEVSVEVLSTRAAPLQGVVSHLVHRDTVMSGLKLRTGAPGKGQVLCTVLPIVFGDSQMPLCSFKALSDSLVMAWTGVMKKKEKMLWEERSKTRSRRGVSDGPLLAVRLI